MTTAHLIAVGLAGITASGLYLNLFLSIHKSNRERPMS